MPLIDIWKSTPEQLESKTIQQLLGFAGDGRLRDANDTSQEFRSFLRHVPSDWLVNFANQCLNESFPQSGFALQDVVNEVGRRLGFRVQEGRYRGAQGAVGLDGLWATEDRRTILVEVKTTDAYRLSLETTANYRSQLIQDQKVSEEESSILYIVGRNDTGDLEAQVRGSRHSWYVRIISVDALLRLLKIKEELEDPSTIERIRGVLTPHEFTRVDGIIDLVFTTTKEVKQEEDVELDTEADGRTETGKKFTPVSYRDACISRLQSHLRETLVQRTFAIFSSPDDTLGVMCAISREYAHGDRAGYWFAFRPFQKDALLAYPKAFVCFGCGSENQIVVFPYNEFIEWLPQMNTTESNDRFYWHVHISRNKKKFSLDTKREFENIDISRYLI
jgi:hypothetical protein